MGTASHEQRRDRRGDTGLAGADARIGRDVRSLRADLGHPVMMAILAFFYLLGGTMMWVWIGKRLGASPMLKGQYARDAIVGTAALKSRVEELTKALEDSQNLLKLVRRLNTHGSVSGYDWEKGGLGNLIPKQIGNNHRALGPAMPLEDRK